MNVDSPEIPSPYPAKLNDPRFVKLSSDIMKRDGGRCFNCGSEDFLQVRHVVHRGRDPWAYPPELYHVICRKCHDRRGDVLQKLFDAVKVHFRKTKIDKLDAWVEDFLSGLAGNGK